ncbi:OB-fold nucleic acid binding domain-containing protein [Kineosporia babensis]|uniref:OB-fold nucleic acid binding domain-containing protein n=1 Tax=Kineosporia babensis TaxID=499548 RepID=A0A9X1SVN8_9ACTN|nr:OB-fold nucleic acid binding domain-containing protein [Kineosporia babensis]MCD5314202.1 OB-fold nucleic acid binding domain-containing protein [Kineosporia babensis]
MGTLKAVGKQITGDQAPVRQVVAQAGPHAGAPAEKQTGSPGRSGFFRALARFTAPQHVVHADEEHEQAVRLGGTPIDQLRSRQQAMVCGTLRAVTLRPRAGVPALVAELYDGTGSISVVWLGRRHIGGVEPGRRIRVQGVVCEASGTATIFNPRYELVPGGPS